MRNTVEYAVALVVSVVVIYGMYSIFTYRTSRDRAKDMMTGLLCDSVLEKKIRDELHKKRPIDAPPPKKTIWLWAVDHAARQMLKEKVYPKTLKALFGQKMVHFGSLSQKILVRAKAKCGLSLKTKGEQFKVAMVWKLIASYAELPSPIHCLKCMLPEEKRVAMLGGMERELPITRWFKKKKVVLSAEEINLIDRFARDFVKKNKWVLRRFIVPTEERKLPYMKIVQHSSNILDKDPYNKQALFEMGRAHLAIGQAFDGVRELQMVAVLCQKHLRQEPRAYQILYLKAVSLAALSLYEQAQMSLRKALFWAEKKGAISRLDGYRLLIREYGKNQKALEAFNR